MELPVLTVSLKWSSETIVPKATVGIKLKFMGMSWRVHMELPVLFVSLK